MNKYNIILLIIVQCYCGVAIGLAVKSQDVVMAAVAVFILQLVTRMQAQEEAARLADKSDDKGKEVS